MAESGCRLVEVGTHQPHAPRRLRARARRRHRARAQGARVELPHGRLRRVHAGRRSSRRSASPVMVDAGSGLLDDTTPWLARPARVAARRARRAPGARRRRGARHVLGRQAARRPAGRGHRRAAPTWSPRIARHPARPGDARRQDDARRAPVGRARVPRGRRDGDPVLADGDDDRSTSCACGPRRIARAVAGRQGRRHRGGRRAAARCPGLTIPSVGVAVEAADPRRARARLRDAGCRRAGRRRHASCATCAPSIPTDDARRRATALAAIACTREGRRDRRPRRPRQVVARPRAHRHRSRPLPGGEGARAHDRPRLRVHHAAVGHRGRLRRRARARALRQEHARRRRRGRRRAARRRRQRRMDAADRGAPARSSSCSASRTGSSRSRRPTSSTTRRSSSRSSSVAEHLDGTRACARRPSWSATRVSGRGLDDVRAALDAVLAARRRPRDRGRPRLWVDRVFAATGRGHRRDRHAGRRRGRASTTSSRSGATARRRGSAASRPRTAASSASARVRASRSTSSGVEHARSRARRRARASRPMDARDGRRRRGHARARRGGRGRGRGCRPTSGSGEHDGVVPRARRRADGSRGCRFAPPLPLAPGDRLVLRDPGATRTVAGAEVLDVDRRRSTAAMRAGAADAAARPRGCSRVAAGSPVADVARLDRAVGRGRRRARSRGASSRGSRRATSTTRSSTPPARARVRDRATRHGSLGRRRHRARPLASSLGVDASDAPRARSTATPQLVGRSRGRARRGTRSPITESPEARRARCARCDATPFAPPETDGRRRSTRALVREGVLVDVDGIVFTASAVDRARELVRRARWRRSGTITRRQTRATCSRARASTWCRSSSSSTEKA